MEDTVGIKFRKTQIYTWRNKKQELWSHSGQKKKNCGHTSVGGTFPYLGFKATADSETITDDFNRYLLQKGKLLIARQI